jgi:hypothetical protein
VTVKGTQRAVRLTTVSLVDDGFIYGTGIQCPWKNISGASVFQNEICDFILLRELKVVNMFGRFKCTYLKIYRSGFKEVSKTVSQTY